jgi:hypothetical protein
MKALQLRYIFPLALFALLASGTALAGTLNANGASIKSQASTQANTCANPPCVYATTNAAPINNDPNSEAGLRNKANLAKTSTATNPTRKSRVPEGSTFYFLLIGAVVFFFVRFLSGRKKEG